MRLWDWRALIENLRQQQEIRLYYQFNDVDIDRYFLDGEYRQVQRHIRYPVDFFTIQTEMYTAYHMVNPETFYQKEDLWEFATERYREEFQIVSPYYVMIEFPENEMAEFALIVPFTPRNKNVMNAWMAGRSDMPNYGKLTVYPFPKGEQVFGPRQIEARIDQNTIMSQSITLWSQRGSEVIGGNMLVVPLFHNDSLFVLYVEPLYIQATDSKLPEVKRVITGDQSRVVWAEDFDASIELLERRIETLEEVSPDQPETQIDIQRARELLRQIRDLAAQGSFSEAGSRFEELTRLLE